MEFTGERCILGISGLMVEKEHLDRYEFAKTYVKEKTVLDIACGAGYGTKILSESAAKVQGVDISDESIKFAKENYRADNITYYVSDATKIKFIEDKSIDVVVSFETLEHIADYVLFLKEIKRTLKEGGKVIISTPNRKYSSPGSKTPLNKYHVIEFMEKEFRELLQSEFKNVKIYGQDFQSYYKIIKKLAARVMLRFFRFLVPVKLRDLYYFSDLSGISAENAGRSRYFIGVCEK